MTLANARVYKLEIWSFYGHIYFSNKTFVVNFYAEMLDKILSRVLESITLKNTSLYHNQMQTVCEVNVKVKDKPNVPSESYRSEDFSTVCFGVCVFNLMI